MISALQTLKANSEKHKTGSVTRLGRSGCSLPGLGVSDDGQWTSDLLALGRQAQQCVCGRVFCGVWGQCVLARLESVRAGA